MRRATRAELRANAVTIHRLGQHHGLRSFVLSPEPGELVATVDEGRSYLDVLGFESDLSGFLGAAVEVRPRGPVGSASREARPEGSPAESPRSGARTVIRYAQWHMGPDRSGEASPLYQLRCTACEMESSAEEETPQDWAFAHVGKNPSHQHYREMITRFYRMTLVD
ncbi:hypothetical protein ACFYV5_28575 [Streptomyces sp. NPDC003035]|uniref:DUF7848 domain-containing protein n=1 Tax=Streptomyces sp. NPDC003035 TaxID=3364676 RepID=UPI0036BAD88A